MKTATATDLLSNNAWQNAMNTQLSHAINERGCYFQTLFDPTQTHAMYGLTADTLPAAKERLTTLGANRFRVVTNKFKMKILCFSAKKIKMN